MTASVADGGALELNHASSEVVSFAGGTGSLVLDQPANFNGQIAGFTGTAPDATHSDAIDLVGIDYNSSAFSETFDATTGSLTVTDGAHSASFKFDDFAAKLDFASDHHGGTLITDPPAAASSSDVHANTVREVSGDQFVFKNAPGIAGQNTIDSLQGNQPGSNLDHLPSHLHETASESLWSLSDIPQSKADLSLDLNPDDLHHQNLMRNFALAHPHLNDFILSGH
jgi:hypothetical protein